VLAVAFLVGAQDVRSDDFSSPHEPATCAYTEAGPAGPAGNELTVFVPSTSDLTVRMAGMAFAVVDHPEPDQEVIVVCAGGIATATNIDTVRVMVIGSGATEMNVTLEVPNGPLAPGATSEADGQSEIETVLDGYGAQIDLQGGAGSENWMALGDDGMVAAVLSADADRSDFDVVGDAAELRLLGGPGADRIAIPGGEGFEVSSVHGGPGDDLLSGRASELYGDGGNDRLQNGSFSAGMNGGAGNDLVLGGSSRDFISGGPGRDVLLGRGGPDKIGSARGGKDKVDCGGSGADFVVADRGDKVRRCEVRGTKKKR
jgi:hypothetical protein